MLEYRGPEFWQLPQGFDLAGKHIDNHQGFINWTLENSPANYSQLVNNIKNAPEDTAHCSEIKIQKKEFVLKCRR